MTSNVISSPLGIVTPEFFTFGGAGDELLLDCGRFFGPITVSYHTYGQLNPQKDNAILVCHTLTSSALLAGVSVETGRSGWWEKMVGPGRPFDSERYFIICANIFGGCHGTTGPSSINPATGRPYALDFPFFTVEDTVRVQKRLIDHLGIERLLSVIGPSMGGCQALAWAGMYPDSVASVIPVASAARLSARSIAWHEVARRAIMADPNWNNGDYYAPGQPRPEAGLGLARMTGHLTYLSEQGMEAKFGRRLQGRDRFSFSLEIDFEVESYLNYQARTFPARFDANSYLYLTRANDYFDLTGGTGDLVSAFAPAQARFLFLSFANDPLYPPYQSEVMVNALRELGGGRVEYVKIDSIYGHDAFLLETDLIGPIIGDFLARVAGT